VLWLLVLCGVWFANLDYRKLIRTDEGRYAEIAREMALSGDWVTPRSNGLKYFEKPPLQYWATALAFDLFGLHEWCARLWTALTGALGIAFTGFAAARLWGARTGFLAAGILSGSLEWAALGHFATLDMSLSASMSGAILAVCLAQSDRAGMRERRAWMITAWGLAALALLSKGLVALVLPGAALACYMLWELDWALARRLHPAAGLGLLLILSAPWFIAVARANPEFLQFFFIHEHLERYLTRVHGRDAPLWYFLPVLAGGIQPWIVALPGALRLGARREPGRFQPQRLLLVWAVLTFAFFSVSHSKLASYILPVYPALAILLARFFNGLSARALRWNALPIVLLGIAVAVAAPMALRASAGSLPLALREAYSPWLVGAGLALAAGAALAASLAAWQAAGARTAGLLAMGLGGLLAAQLALWGHQSLAPVFSSYDIAQKIKPYLTGDTAFYAVDTYDHTLPYYTGRTMTLVSYRDELSPGIEAEPGRFVPDIVRFEQLWRAAPRAVAFMNPGRFEQFSAEGLPMLLIARDTRRVLVAKPGMAPGSPPAPAAAPPQP
jgi:4-amino-4-deoxy-L-arabinose transferase-like glycosyltransferase